MKVKVLAAQSCLALCESRDCSLPGSSIHGIYQARKNTAVDCILFQGFPGGSAGKEPTCKEGNPGSIPGLGRSPGEENSYPLQYSGLENSMDCTVHGIAKNWTQLSNVHFTSLHFRPRNGIRDS